MAPRKTTKSDPTVIPSSFIQREFANIYIDEKIKGKVFLLESPVNGIKSIISIYMYANVMLLGDVALASYVAELSKTNHMIKLCGKGFSIVGEKHNVNNGKSQMSNVYHLSIDRKLSDIEFCTIVDLFISELSEFFRLIKG